MALVTVDEASVTSYRVMKLCLLKQITQSEELMLIKYVVFKPYLIYRKSVTLSSCEGWC